MTKRTYYEILRCVRRHLEHTGKTRLCNHRAVLGQFKVSKQHNSTQGCTEVVHSPASVVASVVVRDIVSAEIKFQNTCTRTLNYSIQANQSVPQQLVHTTDDVRAMSRPPHRRRRRSTSHQRWCWRSGCLAAQR